MDNELGEILSEDLDGRDGLTSKFKTADDLAKAYRSMEQSMSQTLRVPDENASPEQWSKYYERMGVPDDQSGYEIPESDNGLGEALRAMSESAAEAKLSTKQWDSIVSKVLDHQQSTQQQLQQSLEEANQRFEGELRKQLGEKADETLALSQRFRDQVFGNSEDADPANQLVLDLLEKHPVAAQIFAEAARATGSKNTPAGAGGGMDPTAEASTLADEYKKLRELARKPGFNPDKDALQSRMKAIQERLAEMDFEGIHDPRLRKDPLAS